MNNNSPNQTNKNKQCCPCEFSSDTKILWKCRRGIPNKGNANKEVVGWRKCLKICQRVNYFKKIESILNRMTISVTIKSEKDRIKSCRFSQNRK